MNITMLVVGSLFSVLVLGLSGGEINSNISDMKKNGNYVLQGNVYTDDNDISYIDDGTGSIQASGCRNCNGYGVIHVKKQSSGYTANRFKPTKRVSNYYTILDKKFSLMGDSVLTEDGWKNVKIIPDNATRVTLVNGEWIAN